MQMKIPPSLRGSVENWKLMEQFPHLGSPKNPKETLISLRKINFSHGKLLFLLLVHVTSKSTSWPKGEIPPPRPYINTSHLASLGGTITHIHPSSFGSI